MNRHKKPQNSQKLSPSKVSCYVICYVHAMIYCTMDYSTLDYSTSRCFHMHVALEGYHWSGILCMATPLHLCALGDIHISMHAYSLEASPL